MLAGIIKYFWKLSSYRTIKNINKRGDHTLISLPIYISKPENIFLGNDVYIGPDAWISSFAEVHICNGTIIGPRLKIYTGNHNYDNDKMLPYDEVTIAKKVIIKENVWIGGDVIILPGITIEEGAVIGAGALINKNVPKGAVVGGNPFQIIKYRDLEKYEKLKLQGKIYLREKQMGNIKMKVNQQ